MRGGKSCSLVELLPPFFPLSIVVFLKLSTNQSSWYGDSLVPSPPDIFTFDDR